VVLGGAGFIGSHLARALAEKGDEVCIVDNFSGSPDCPELIQSAALRYRRNLISDLKVFRADAADTLELTNVFESFRPTHVVNLVALSRAPLNDELIGTAVRLSSTTICALASLAKVFSISRELHVSSSYVYGSFVQDPCGEDAPCNPSSIYGSVKLTAELLVRSILNRLNVPWTICRLIGVYGPSDLNGKLSMINLEAMIRNMRFPFDLSVDNRTDFTFISDAVDGIRLALHSELACGQIFNISHGVARSSLDVFNLLASQGIQITNVLDTPRAIGAPRRGALSTAKASQILGYASKVNLEEGLIRCLHYIKEWHGNS